MAQQQQPDAGGFAEWRHCDTDRTAFKQRKRDLIAFGIRTKEAPNRHLRTYFTTRRYDSKGSKLQIDLFNYDVDDPKCKNVDRQQLVIDCGANISGPLRTASIKVFRRAHTVVLRGARFVDKCALHINAKVIVFDGCTWDGPNACVIHRADTKVRVNGPVPADQTVRFRVFKDRPTTLGAALGGGDGASGLEGLLRLAALRAAVRSAAEEAGAGSP